MALASNAQGLLDKKSAVYFWYECPVQMFHPNEIIGKTMVVLSLGSARRRGARIYPANTFCNGFAD